MKKRWTMFVAGVALIGFAGLPAAEAGEIKNREERQQGRIAEGIESGQLTAREAARLERGQAKIETDRQKALQDGTVTKKEKARLTREQNAASRQIYRQKHDAQTR